MHSCRKKVIFFSMKLFINSFVVLRSVTSLRLWEAFNVRYMGICMLLGYSASYIAALLPHLHSCVCTWCAQLPVGFHLPETASCPETASLLPQAVSYIFCFLLWIFRGSIKRIPRKTFLSLRNQEVGRAKNTSPEGGKKVFFFSLITLCNFGWKILVSIMLPCDQLCKSFVSAAFS